MSDSVSPLTDRIDALLTRLSCDSVVGSLAPEALRSGLVDLATLLEGSAVSTASAFASDVRARLAQPPLTDSLLDEVVERWERVKPTLAHAASSQLTTSTPSAPSATPAPPSASALPADEGHSDAELETLASDAEMASMFVAEALDHLGTIENVLLQLESSPDDVKLLNDVFRPFHTIKGNAGALGVTSVQELAHIVENLLDLARSGKHRMGPAEVEVVLEAVDLLTLMIGELPARLAGTGSTDVRARRRTLMAGVTALIAGDGTNAHAPQPAAAQAAAVAPALAAPASAPAPPLAPAAPPVSPTVVASARDAFPERVTDSSVAEAKAKAAAPQQRADVAERPAVADPGKTIRKDDPSTTVKVDTRKLDNLIDMVGELVIAQSILAADPSFLQSNDERLGRRMAQLKRITSELQRNAMSMRMMPIRQTFQKMARLVRDLSKRSGKQIELVLQGEDTELDRRVVEDINDPLMHMVRNSVDHGIETADARLAAGKPVPAILRLSASHQAGNIVIEIADDGAGLNTERILAKAIERGLAHEGATLAPADIHQLIFQPGFSTAEKVTEISGRGVGMDVVRRNIDALRGQIDIQSAKGVGTTFSIRLPLTLAIVDGIMLGVGRERFVIPTFAVRESLRPLPSQIHTLQGSPCMVRVREQLIPTLHLGEVFSVDGATRDIAASTVVVIEDAGRTVALVIDELLGKQEVVIKSLGETFKNVRGLAGGAILGDGRIGLILDAGGLIAMAGRSGMRVAA